LILAYLDECGFSPSQPVNATWTLPGRPKLIPYENPRRRRLNAIAALVPDGPHRSFTWGHAPRSLTANDLLTCVRQIPRAGLPLVVVLDNGSIHVSRVVKAAEAELAAEGISLFYLPPYSPKLNAIEPYFGGVKHYDLPERTYPALDDLAAAVDHAFERVEARLLSRPRSLSLPQESEHEPRRAA
jgi:DDE superfamily endonuclease